MATLDAGTGQTTWSMEEEEEEDADDDLISV
jgi:hypothetical protein